jgi:hypothetical protein
MNSKTTVGIAAVAVVLFGSWYWFSYKPTKIRERCLAEAEFNPYLIANPALETKSRQEFIEREYSLCLHRWGIK